MNQAVKQVNIAFNAAPDRLGYYESELEAGLMIQMSIRHAEGVATLAREGIVMYPAAMVLARAAYEGAIWDENRRLRYGDREVLPYAGRSAPARAAPIRGG